MIHTKHAVPVDARRSHLLALDWFEEQSNAMAPGTCLARLRGAACAGARAGDPADAEKSCVMKNASWDGMAFDFSV